MGRPATPTHLKLVTGNPGNRAIDLDSEPAVDLLAPDCPRHLDRQAVQEWKRIVPELERAGLLTRIDRAALAMYCQAYSRWQLAEQQIRELAKKKPDGHGLVEHAANGFKMQSQWLIISNKAQEQLRAYLTDFGMSPSARARVKAIKAGQASLFPDTDPMEGFMRAGNRAPVG